MVVQPSEEVIDIGMLSRLVILHRVPTSSKQEPIRVENSWFPVIAHFQRSIFGKRRDIVSLSAQFCNSPFHNTFRCRRISYQLE